MLSLPDQPKHLWRPSCPLVQPLNWFSLSHHLLPTPQSLHTHHHPWKTARCPWVLILWTCSVIVWWVNENISPLIIKQPLRSARQLLLNKESWSHWHSQGRLVTGLQVTRKPQHLGMELHSLITSTNVFYPTFSLSLHFPLLTYITRQLTKHPFQRTAPHMHLQKGLCFTTRRAKFRL